MTSQIDLGNCSPRLLARIVGIIGLAGIVTGAFSIGYVHNALIVAGNSSATLHNVLAHETLFRWGVSSHLFELVLNVAGEIIFFILIRRVNGILASIALCCGVVGIAIEAVDIACSYFSMQLALEGNAGAFTAGQISALSHLAGQLEQSCLLLSWVFYGLDELISGVLIFRSGFLPRILGIMLGIAGLCYFANGFLNFLSPALDARLNPYITYACFPGEFSISLWMAVVGLNLNKWNHFSGRGAHSVDSSLPGALAS
jgi:hypothetical protein